MEIIDPYASNHNSKSFTKLCRYDYRYCLSIALRVVFKYCRFYLINIIIFYGRDPTGRAFGTRFFICPSEQIKIAQTKPLSLTQQHSLGMFHRVRDASENPFVRYEQKIEATARSASWRKRPKKPTLLQYLINCFLRLKFLRDLCG